MSYGRFGMSTMLSCALLLSGVAAAEDFVPPDAPANVAELGAGIQRTMTLLATSTPEKRNHVRILFYGQSVTAGPWSYAVAEDLRKAYPNADIEVENRAIGGYEAGALINTAEADLYPFYPDLMIFHVYGGMDGKLEQIMERTRQRTAAEILIRTPHFRWPPDLARDVSQDDPKAQGVYQADEKQSVLIRDVAKKYGLELCEVREQLRKYLKDHNQFPKDTLGDSVHPNKFGNFLLEKLVMFSLRYDEKFPKTPWENLVRDIPAGDAAVKRGADGSLEVAFEGNRVDVIAASSNDAKLGTAKVLIDDKPPSAFPELYYHTRTSKAPQVWWPSINRVGSEKPPVVEKWTARVIECDIEKNILKYEVEGSVTGLDGQGDQSKKFVSNSGRVVIDPGMWMVVHTLKYKKIPLPTDFVVTWEVKPLFVDTYQAPKTENAAKEYYTTLAQGLSNGKHTLKLVPNGDGALPIATFRAYRPPLAVEPPPAAAK
ncbi:MAG: hypothetical protein A3K19_02775 [Lentisphaerae bacterium RIFOXYB12_FULL_65_16]|nr:MAG: hypothetical protein A3K18_19825 [Lentisphaerae bacterium RIFOXYA12_64_32]OGV92276.1 MAG: hypothetical protein A3K19_02775 [Lentisphaerae bacterium RIFOXYB12_FULL_65_16]